MNKKPLVLLSLLIQVLSAFAFMYASLRWLMTLPKPMTSNTYFQVLVFFGLIYLLEMAVSKRL